MSTLMPLVRSPALTELWQRWSEILMWFALKRPDRKRVKPAYYEALYRELIATCQEMATSDLKRRKFYESIAELVSPWLTTRVLERTDRSLLLDLWQRCQQVDRQFGLRASWRKIIVWVLRILVAAGVVGLAVAVTPWARSQFDGTFPALWRNLRTFVLGLTLIQKLLATGFGVALFGAASVSYMRSG